MDAIDDRIILIRLQKLRTSVKFLIWCCIIIFVFLLGLLFIMDNSIEASHRSELASIRAANAAEKSSEDLSNAIENSTKPNPQLIRAFEAIFYIEAILKQEFGEVNTTGG